MLLFLRIVAVVVVVIITRDDFQLALEHRLYVVAAAD